nr:LysR family transcriptional regulator [Lachnospiraceae bacterium]
EYGCKLFIYDKRSLSMTKEAKVLRSYGENVLYQENRVKEVMKQSFGKNLRMGATKTIGEYVIGPMVSKYLKEEGNTISIEVDNTERLLALMEEGKLDFALVEGFFDRSKYKSRLFREESFVGVCEKHHPFAEKAVSMRDLFGEHLFIREEGSGTKNIFEQILKERNHSIEEFSKVTGVGNFGLMFQLLKNEGGITFAYESVLKEDKNLRKFTIKGSEIKREFNYVFLDNPISQEMVTYFHEISD